MTVSARLGRTLAAGAITLTTLVGVSACQFQSLQQYTPAEGTNTSIGGVDLRNLVIVVTSDGQGVLSGTLVTDSSDQLTQIGGQALLSNGLDGSPLQVTTAGPIAVEPANPTLLLGSGIYITSADLQSGLTARVQFTFRDAGQVTRIVPVLSTESPEFRGVTIPTPTPSASSSSTPG